MTIFYGFNNREESHNTSRQHSSAFRISSFFYKMSSNQSTPNSTVSSIPAPLPPVAVPATGGALEGSDFAGGVCRGGMVGSPHHGGDAAASSEGAGAERYEAGSEACFEHAQAGAVAAPGEQAASDELAVQEARAIRKRELRLRKVVEKIDRYMYSYEKSLAKLRLHKSRNGYDFVVDQLYFFKKKFQMVEDLISETKRSRSIESILERRVATKLAEEVKMELDMYTEIAVNGIPPEAVLLEELSIANADVSELKARLVNPDFPQDLVRLPGVTDAEWCELQECRANRCRIGRALNYRRHPDWENNLALF